LKYQVALTGMGYFFSPEGLCF